MAIQNRICVKFVLIMSILISALNTSAFANNSQTISILKNTDNSYLVYANETQITFNESKIYSESENVKIPLRIICENIGYTVLWNDSDKTICLVKEGKEIIIWTDSKQISDNGNMTILSEVPQIVDGTTYISSKDFANLFDYTLLIGHIDKVVPQQVK